MVWLLAHAAAVFEIHDEIVWTVAPVEHFWPALLVTAAIGLAGAVVLVFLVRARRQ